MIDVNSLLKDGTFQKQVIESVNTQISEGVRLFVSALVQLNSTPVLTYRLSETASNAVDVIRRDCKEGAVITIKELQALTLVLSLYGSKQMGIGLPYQQSVTINIPGLELELGISCLIELGNINHEFLLRITKR